MESVSIKSNNGPDYLIFITNDLEFAYATWDGNIFSKFSPINKLNEFLRVIFFDGCVFQISKNVGWEFTSQNNLQFLSRELYPFSL
ncbi:hypothetical protein C440_15709 [Haloferax mucosum ATCC BAA-1512]|uniref:Uncharacterized protein n=1 Tax=Haloferax mucosum ATCC BAA-1512 TaxID=662479 RepID=M0I6X7_9EURY|nr:hypothetical protein C440_15709 [Haloferax mucosum ATCC BAA-1512]